MIRRIGLEQGWGRDETGFDGILTGSTTATELGQTPTKSCSKLFKAVPLIHAKRFNRADPFNPVKSCSKIVDADQPNHQERRAAIVTGPQSRGEGE
jgi:hypothetical protein